MNTSSNIRIIRALCAAFMFSLGGALTAINGATVTPPTFATNSKLTSSGRWIRIKCDKPGMQEIPYDSLRTWGFSDPSKVRVYGFPTTMLSTGSFTIKGLPENLPLVRTLRWPASAPSKLIFYNAGELTQTTRAVANPMPTVYTEENRFGAYTTYLLTDTRSNVSSEKDDAPTISYYKSGNTKNTQYHRALQYNRPRKEQATEAAAVYADTPWTGTYSQTYTLKDAFPISQFLTSQLPRFFFNAIVKNAPSTSLVKIQPSATLPAFADMMQYDYMTVEGKASSTTFHYSPSTEGWYQFNYNKETIPNKFDLTFDLNVTSPVNAAMKPALLFSGLVYPRYNILRNNESQMMMYFDFINPATDNITFPGSADKIDAAGTENIALDKNFEVWDVSYPLYPFKLQLNKDTAQSNSSYSASLSSQILSSAYGQRNLSYPVIAFRPDMKFSEPVSLGEIGNQNLHALKVNKAVPEMVIITTNSLKSEAERLANAHMNIQKMNVAVVTSDQVINEYTAGNPHPMAYRLFAKNLHQRGMKSDGTSTFKYLLLFGPSVWDYLHTKTAEGDYLLAFGTYDKEFANAYGRDFSSNDYFGDLKDDVDDSNHYKSAPTIAVGMIDAYNTDEARDAVDKVINYLKNPPVQGDYYTRTTLLADGQGMFVTTAESSKSLLEKSNPYLTQEKDYIGLYPLTSSGDTPIREALIKSLNDGRYYLNYIGHANPSEFRYTKQIWNTGLAKNTSYDVLPIGMFATCDAYTFGTLDKGITHQMLMNPTGGVIAAVAAARTVYHQNNMVLSRAFDQALYANAKPGWTVGDAYLNAKTISLAAQSNLKLQANNRAFNLAGDPAIPLIVPSKYAVVTSINATTVSPDFNKQTKGSVTVKANNQLTIKGTITTDSLGNTVDRTFNGKVYLAIYDQTEQRSTVYSSDNVARYYNIETNHTPLTRLTADVKNGEFTFTLTAPESVQNDSNNRISFFAASDKNVYAKGRADALQILAADPTQAATSIPAPEISGMYVNTPDFTDGDLIDSDVTVYVSLTDAAKTLDSRLNTTALSVKFELDGSQVLFDGSLNLLNQGTDNYLLSYPAGKLAQGDHSATITLTDGDGKMKSKAIYFRVDTKPLTGTLAVAESPARTNATFSMTGYNAVGNPSGRLVVTDNTGKTVYTASVSPTSFTWNLKDNAGKKVKDGVYNATLKLADGKRTGYTNKAQVIVVAE